MRHIKKLYIFSFIIFTGLALSACKSIDTISSLIIPETPDKIINLSIEADAGSNPDLAGRPSPTVIKIYQLSSDGQFKDTDFFTLYEDDSALDKDVLENREIVLASKTANALLMTLDAKTQYIGITAAFAQSNNAKYKLIFPISSDLTQHASVKLLMNQLTLEN